MRRLRHSVAALAALTLCLAPAGAKVLLSPEEAIREAFGGAPAEKRTDYLDEAQAAAIAKAAGSPASSRIVISWRAAKDGHALGTAYLETHIVRTLPETILIVLDPEGRVAKVEILTFDEPDQYRPRDRWMDQFRGRSLDAELSLSKGVRGVTGATLSSRAITSAVRRVLATHAVLLSAKKPSPTPGAAPASPPPGASRASPSATPPSPSAGSKPRAAGGSKMNAEAAA